MDEPIELLKLDAFMPGERKNCDKHCWCAYSEDDYPGWAVIISGMKSIEHDHGDVTVCPGCMMDDGRITFGVDLGAGYSIGYTTVVPRPWREGDPAPPDATELFDGLSKDG